MATPQDHEDPRDAQDDEHARVAALMARLAAGDDRATFALVEEFGGRLAGVMRRHLRTLGLHHVPDDEVQGLVLDAALELRACAGGWRPDGGALPWTWAGARLRALAARHVGFHTDELDEHALAEAEAGEPVVRIGDEQEAYDLLAQLGEAHPLARLLVDALARVGSARDQAIVLELRLQADLGDPSPSHTVGAGMGASPDAVRQVGSRMRRRLRELAATDERYAPLGDLPLVA